MSDVSQQIVSANDLLEGDVVYLTHVGTWTRSLSDAAIAVDKAAAAKLLQTANAQPERVVGPTLVNIYQHDNRVVPAHFRERLRDTGPSILATDKRNAL